MILLSTAPGRSRLSQVKLLRVAMISLLTAPLRSRLSQGVES